MGSNIFTNINFEREKVTRAKEVMEYHIQLLDALEDNLTELSNLFASYSKCDGKNIPLFTKEDFFDTRRAYWFVIKNRNDQSENDEVFQLVKDQAERCGISNKSFSNTLKMIEAEIN